MRGRGMQLGSGAFEHPVHCCAQVAVIPRKAEEIGGGTMIRGVIT